MTFLLSANVRAFQREDKTKFIEKTVQLFTDDTIGAVLEKISHQFGQKLTPYAWIEPNIPISHNFQSPANPATPWDWIQSPPESPIFIDMSSRILCDVIKPTKSLTINVIFSDKVSYLYPEIVRKLSTYETETKMLLALQYQKSSSIKDGQFNRLHVDYTIPGQTYELSSLWGSLRLNKTMCFARYTDGLGPSKSKAKYRLFKKHNIPRLRLENMIRTGHNLQGVANIIVFFQLNKDAYMMAYIFPENKVQIHYHFMWQLKVGSPVTERAHGFLWDLLKITRPAKSLRTVTKVHMRTLLPLAMEWEKFSRGLAFIPFVFRRVKTEIGDGLEFMRISNYRPAAPKNDLTKAKEIEAQTVLYLTKNNEGLQIDIHSDVYENAISAIRYMEELVKVAESTKSPAIRELFFNATKKAPEPMPLPVPVPVPLPAPKNESVKTKSKSKSASDSSSGFFSDSGEANLDLNKMSGGAGYFLERIKKFDPAINEGTDYARKCGATGSQQPVPLTKDEKAYIDKHHPGSYDNVVHFGSDSAHKAYYICPRIWCPQSGVSLTAQQLAANNGKCPKGENPYNLYDKTYWQKDPEKPHYVDFITKADNSFCLPCCYKTIPKKSNLEKCTDQNPLSPAQAKDQISKVKTEQQVRKAIVAAAGYVLGDKHFPLDKGRLGEIPQGLQDHFNDKLVRKGINHDDTDKQALDSLMNALLEITGIKSKSKLIAAIREKLTDEAFLCIDDGYLFRHFQAADSVGNVNAAKKAYLAYLNSSTIKELSLIWGVCRYIFGFELVTWQKTETDAYLLCNPYPIDPYIARPIVMVLQNKVFYEPLYVLEGRSETSSIFISAIHYPDLYQRVAEFSRQCYNTNANIFDTTKKAQSFFRSLSGFSQIYLGSPKALDVKTWIINEDGYITAAVLENQMVIAASENYIPSALWWQGKQQIMFSGSLSKTMTWKAYVSSNVLQPLESYFATMGFNIKGIPKTGKSEPVLEIVVTPKDLPGPTYNPKLYASNNDFEKWEKNYSKVEQEWKGEAKKLAAAVIARLIGDKGVTKASLLKIWTSPIQQYLLEHLFRDSDTITDARRVRDWLSEEIDTWIDWFSPSLYDIQNGKVWEFTRAHAPLPEELYLGATQSIKQNLFEGSMKPYENATDSKPVWEKITPRDVLPVKWRSIFAAKEYIAYKPLHTPENQLPELVRVLEKILQINIPIHHIEFMTKLLYSKVMTYIYGFENLKPDHQKALFMFSHESLLVDPYILKVAKNVFNSTIRTTDELWNALQKSSSILPREDLLREIFQSPLRSADLPLFVISQIFNINVLVLHSRKTYLSKSKPEAESEVDTCALFSSPLGVTKSPTIIMYRDKTDSSFVYYPIVTEAKWIFSWKEIPMLPKGEDIKKLITVLRKDQMRGRVGVVLNANLS